MPTLPHTPSSSISSAPSSSLHHSLPTHSGLGARMSDSISASVSPWIADLKANTSTSWSTFMDYLHPRHPPQNSSDAQSHLRQILQRHTASLQLHQQRQERLNTQAKRIKRSKPSPKSPDRSIVFDSDALLNSFLHNNGGYLDDSDDDSDSDDGPKQKPLQADDDYYNYSPPPRYSSSRRPSPSNASPSPSTSNSKRAQPSPSLPRHRSLSSFKITSPPPLKLTDVLFWDPTHPSPQNTPAPVTTSSSGSKPLVVISPSSPCLGSRQTSTLGHVAPSRLPRSKVSFSPRGSTSRPSTLARSSNPSLTNHRAQTSSNSLAVPRPGTKRLSSSGQRQHPIHSHSVAPCNHKRASSDNQHSPSHPAGRS